MFWKKRTKINTQSSKCSICGENHKEWPALTFNSPSIYDHLMEIEKLNLAELNSDFCTIDFSDQTNRFIRVVLLQKIKDSDEFLNYGLWVSLSENSFIDYVLNYENENHESQYFGWLSNRIAEYDDTLNIPTTVYTKKGNERPEIIPHDDYKHKFVEDYYIGITKSEAEKRIHEMLKNAR